MAANAQKDVIKFLGIPVDGYKTEMQKKLIGKGFTYNSLYDFYEGEFNGRDVNVYVVTNNNKVWRIMVCDRYPCDETSIKIRFNNLCRQFAKNQKYVSTALNENSNFISDDEDISYEMLVHSKRYEASYCQVPDSSMIDTLAVQNRIRKSLLQQYSQEQLENPTDKQREEMEFIAKREMITVALEIMEKKTVWFMISEHYGEYYITMYYDNEYNRSDGEDL